MQIIVYGADWCGPSKIVKGVLSRAKIDYEFINIDSEPNKAADVNVRGTPTTILSDCGNEIKRFVGSAPELANKIQEFLVNE